MTDLPPYHIDAALQTLSEDELGDFFADLDHDGDGHVTFDELEAKLEQVHMELAPEPKPHHLHHPTRRFLRAIKSQATASDPENGSKDPQHDGLHDFLLTLMPSSCSRVSQADFIELVRSWNIPSQTQTSSEQADAADATLEQKLPLPRRIAAYWSVQGPRILFIWLVVALQLAFGIWQGVKYIQSPDIRAAIGWGVILAKFCAGALYPTIFFLLLSMSRHFSTFMRRFYHVSRFVNWDRSQSFHIWMACSALGLAALHAIGHLSGTFLYGSRPAQQDNLAVILGPQSVPKSYASFASSLPGWTGIASLSMFLIISLLSLPSVRRWSYELFQLAHLLMFPLVGLLSAHGIAQILDQFPMLGFWMLLPASLIVGERLHRVYRGFVKVPGRMEVLDDDTVRFVCKHPRGKDWRYQAGQYVLLQVREVSLFQWHPFTISACSGDVLQLHIKTDGNWTRRLRTLSKDRELVVGIDGPFGAPAQRFYDFNYSLIIGSGVGITPFSAIITDLEQNMKGTKDPWSKSRHSSRNASRTTSRRTSVDDPNHLEHTEVTNGQILGEARSVNRSVQIAIDVPLEKTQKYERPSRRVDFHWMVREKNHLLWFSSLLNKAHDQFLAFRSEKSTCPLQLNIQTHITAKRKNISTHVFRYLLDSFRTSTAPYSALTGLKTRSHFGRPDLCGILRNFHDELVAQDVTDEKVGVFFCGSPKIGRVLADECSELTGRARQDGSKIRYMFLMEVFG